MARYKVTYTIYKDPNGKTLKGPSFIHWVGDLCQGLGLIGVLGVIVSFMEHFGTSFIIGCVVAAVAGFALGPVLHKQAKKSAEAKCLEVLARQEENTASNRNPD